MLWWWLVATSVLLLGMAIGPTREFIERIDEWWLDLMVAAEVDGLITLSEIVAFAGATEVSVPILLGAAIWLGRRASWDRLGVLLGAIILSEATLSILKALYGRPRPPAEFMLEVTRSSSFPSGHSIMAATTAIAFVYVFARAGNPARRWFYVAAAYTVVMALSRTYLRVLSDVTIGLVIGVSSVLASVWIVERFTVGISGALKSALGWVARKQG
jgi:undecaprenyl-diphosphatase